MNQRAALYAEIAHITVATDNRKVRSVVDDILRELEAARVGPP
jgi:shikimate kinase